MKKMAFILAVAVLFTITLTGCSQKVVLNVYNWGDYIGEDVIKQFEGKYPDIKINYEMFDTNEDMYTKLKNSKTAYDVIVPSDYMIEKLIKEDMLLKLQLNNIPNYKYIAERFRKLSFDPKGEYSVPYMWGVMGVLYNKTMVDEENIDWDILWNEKYKNQIFVIDSMREAIGVALSVQGYSMNSTNPQELQAAKQKLIVQKQLVLATGGDELKDKMISGEAALMAAWSGDAVLVMQENEDLAFALPKRSNYYIDSMVIPKTSQHQKEAEYFINFMCETEIALQNTEYIGYSTPHTGAYEQLEPELQGSMVAYPSEEITSGYEVFKDLGESAKVYDQIWTEARAS